MISQDMWKPCGHLTWIGSAHTCAVVIHHKCKGRNEAEDTTSLYTCSETSFSIKPYPALVSMCAVSPQHRGNHKHFPVLLAHRFSPRYDSRGLHCMYTTHTFHFTSTLLWICGEVYPIKTCTLFRDAEPLPPRTQYNWCMYSMLSNSECPPIFWTKKGKKPWNPYFALTLSLDAEW